MVNAVAVVGLLFCITEQAIRFTQKNKIKEMEYMREEKNWVKYGNFFKKKQKQ